MRPVLLLTQLRLQSNSRQVCQSTMPSLVTWRLFLWVRRLFWLQRQHSLSSWDSEIRAQRWRDRPGANTCLQRGRRPTGLGYLDFGGRPGGRHSMGACQYSHPPLPMLSNKAEFILNITP